MIADNKFRAVVYLSNRKEGADDLKRLALFFDEIYVIFAGVYTIKKEVFDEPKRFVTHTDGKKYLRDFNFFRDTYTGIVLTPDSLEKDLRETIIKFQENGIITELNDLSDDNQFRKIRDMLASLDVQDEIFKEISESKPEQYIPSTYNIRLAFLDTEEKETVDLICIYPPNAIADSFELTSTLYWSHQIPSFPIFWQHRHKKEMEYRYLQYQKGLEILRKHSSSLISPADFKAQFGEIAFTVANSVFASDLVATKSPDQIIKYRTELADARHRFISKDLMDIASIVQGNPWNAQTREEIEKYIVGKLTQDIIRYNDDSREIWEKMFGNLAVHLAQVAKSTVIGSGAGGLLGNIIPNTSTWQMLLVGALVGAVTEAPNPVKSITDTILEHQKEQRSSIAYISRLR